MTDKYKLTNYERETIILYNDDGKEAECYTCNLALMRKLDGYCLKRPDIYKMTKQDSCSKTYIFPKRYISLRLPVLMTDEQKENSRIRGQANMAILRQKRGLKS